MVKIAKFPRKNHKRSDQATKNECVNVSCGVKFLNIFLGVGIAFSLISYEKSLKLTFLENIFDTHLNILITID